MSGAGNEDLFSSVVAEIKAYHGKDPLCPWLRGIRRLREFLPNKTLAQKLPRFLQRCAETFESDRRYRHDIRYLRVWIQLMDHVDDPRGLLRRMEKNQIGVKHSAFYVAYSLYYEKQKKFEAAEKMYLLGAQRLAEPAAELQKSYEQFVRRMELHKKRKSKLRETRTDEREMNTSKDANETAGGGQMQRSLTEEPGDESANVDQISNEDTVVVNFVGSAIVGKSDAEDACHHGLVDPTVNMKEAMNAISSMFREPLDVDRGPTRKPVNVDLGPTRKPVNVDLGPARQNCPGFKIFMDDDDDDDDGDDDQREDTVVCRFVGSTIAGDRAVENACHGGLVDPTVNLKTAMDEINSMFGKPIDFVRAGRPKKQGCPPVHLDVPRHQEFCILVDDDVDEQPASTSSGGSRADSGLFEPTVFTKEAMNDINDLFSRPLDF